MVIEKRWNLSIPIYSIACLDGFGLPCWPSNRLNNGTHQDMVEFIVVSEGIEFMQEIL